MAEPADEFAGWLAAARAGSPEALGRVLEACRGYLLLVAERGPRPGAAGQGRGVGPGAADVPGSPRGFGRFHGGSEDELLAWLRQLLLNNLIDFTRQYRATAKRGWTGRSRWPATTRPSRGAAARGRHAVAQRPRHGPRAGRGAAGGAWTGCRRTTGRSSGCGTRTGSGSTRSPTGWAAPRSRPQAVGAGGRPAAAGDGRDPMTPDPSPRRVLRRPAGRLRRGDRRRDAALPQLPDGARRAGPGRWTACTGCNRRKVDRVGPRDRPVPGPAGAGPRRVRGGVPGVRPAAGRRVALKVPRADVLRVRRAARAVPAARPGRRPGWTTRTSSRCTRPGRPARSATSPPPTARGRPCASGSAAGPSRSRSPSAAALVAALADGAGHAHARGIVHRDLKPANVLLSEGSRVRSAARARPASPIRHSRSCPRSADHRLRAGQAGRSR